MASDPLVQKYQLLLGVLPWSQFPERPSDRVWPGSDPEPRAPFVAAFLVKLPEGKASMGQLRTFLTEHPALYYWLGLRRIPNPQAAHGFDLAASLPDRPNARTPNTLDRIPRCIPANPLLEVQCFSRLSVTAIFTGLLNIGQG